MKYDHVETEKAFQSDEYRKSLGWGPRELQGSLDDADGFDRTFGTDTGGVDFETPPGTYVPMIPRMFAELMKTLDSAEIEKSTFVDVGSGKGRALMLASNYPFLRIVGVELAPEHHATAERNLALYKNPAQRCSRIESVNADATTFAFPKEDFLLHFFQPFGMAPMRLMLDHLEADLRAHPRRITVLYGQPHNVSEWETRGTWKREGAQGLDAIMPMIAKDGHFPWARLTNLVGAR